MMVTVKHTPHVYAHTHTLTHTQIHTHIERQRQTHTHIKTLPTKGNYSGGEIAEDVATDEGVAQGNDGHTRNHTVTLTLPRTHIHTQIGRGSRSFDNTKTYIKRYTHR